MRRPSHFSLFVCCLALPAASGTAMGGDDFRMFTQPLLIPERGEVINYVVITRSNRFSFLPPPGWNVADNAGEQTVTLLPNDFGAKVSFKIVPGNHRTLEELRTAPFRKEVADRYSEARILRDYACYTGGAQGVAFDIERLSDKRPPVTTRLAFVPIKDGLVEFNLTTESRRFDRYHRVFGNLLTSFRIAPVAASK